MTWHASKYDEGVEMGSREVWCLYSGILLAAQGCMQSPYERQKPITAATSRFDYMHSDTEIIH